MSLWSITGKVCALVVIMSVVACIGMAAARSRGLTAVTVTATDPAKEPVDHRIPGWKQQDALPDYELSLINDRGGVRYLGVKPNTSAAGGLTWELDDPVSTSQVATIRLREQDKIVSDALAEVHLSRTAVESNGYRFEFATETSVGVGVRAFFLTPIGIAIAAAFGIAVLLVILANIAV